ncbi:DHA2 family efflux MFS transporter permease subunit [Nocardia jiangxiensis]|uniref:DHA2 family efflux MFS transporter permease subunit n=1 Tax=Nocardia jiangxiensis TaxID=282685 RepID=UPI0002D6DFF1
MTTQRSPWLALYALVVGFFMILLDMTIVAVANPTIMHDLNTDITKVIWVTSAYLLTYAVPLLVTGRLGDRFGPKNIYLIGLTVFTLASLWCGLSGGIEMLIAARAVQGLGAALMTPQTMAVITRTFAPDKRGAAMGLWGGVAGLATLVGPILGGVLVDQLSWNWIFYINVPIGIVAFALAVWLVPSLPRHEHKFDLVGVALSAIGIFLLVFGIQEGNTRNWDAWIWTMIIAGAVVLVLFVINQALNKGEPLVPMSLFRDRNFALSSVAIAAMGAAITALMVPAYFYLEAVREYSPTRAALVFAPMAIVTGLTAPFIGKISDRMPPRIIPTIGFALFAASIFGFATLMKPDSSIVLFIVIGGVAGLSNSCIWAPLASTATHDLPMELAGAGAGVYNTTRQIGSVLGSAVIAALVSNRMAAQHLGGGQFSEGSGPAKLPAFILHPFSTALSQSMYLPAAILLIGVVASALFTGKHKAPAPGAAETDATTELPVDEEPNAVATPARFAPVDRAGAGQLATSAMGGEQPLSVHVHREDGRPVAGAALTLIDQRGQQVARATGGDNGVYRIAAPVAGQYVLIAAASGHQPAAVTVVTGDRNGPWELTLSGNGELSGVVTTSDGHPLAGVTITLTDSRGEVATAGVTGGDGAYACQGTIAGTYTLVAVAEGRQPHAITLTIPESGTLRYDIELSSTGVLTGRARTDSDVVADAQVSVLDSTGRVVGSVFTDAQGNYRIEDLPAGDYTVVARGYPAVSSRVWIDGANLTHDVNLGYEPAPEPRSAEYSNAISYNGADRS